MIAEKERKQKEDRRERESLRKFVSAIYGPVSPSPESIIIYRILLYLILNLTFVIAARSGCLKIEERRKKKEKEERT